MQRFGTVNILIQMDNGEADCAACSVFCVVLSCVSFVKIESFSI